VERHGDGQRPRPRRDPAFPGHPCEPGLAGRLADRPLRPDGADSGHRDPARVAGAGRARARRRAGLGRGAARGDADEQRLRRHLSGARAADADGGDHDCDRQLHRAAAVLPLVDADLVPADAALDAGARQVQPGQLGRGRGEGGRASRSRLGVGRLTSRCSRH